MANKTMHHAVIGADTFELIDEAGREETNQLKNALSTVVGASETLYDTYLQYDAGSWIATTKFFLVGHNYKIVIVPNDSFVASVVTVGTTPYSAGVIDTLGTDVEFISGIEKTFDYTPSANDANYVRSPSNASKFSSVKVYEVSSTSKAVLFTKNMGLTEPQKKTARENINAVGTDTFEQLNESLKANKYIKSKYGRTVVLDGKNVSNIDIPFGGQAVTIYGKNRFNNAGAIYTFNGYSASQTLTKENDGISVQCNVHQTGAYLYAYTEYTAEFDGELFFSCEADCTGKIEDVCVLIYVNGNEQTRLYGKGLLYESVNVEAGDTVRFLFYTHMGTDAYNKVIYSNIMLAYGGLYSFAKYGVEKAYDLPLDVSKYTRRDGSSSGYFFTIPSSIHELPESVYPSNSNSLANCEVVGMPLIAYNQTYAQAYGVGISSDGYISIYTGDNTTTDLVSFLESNPVEIIYRTDGSQTITEQQYWLSEGDIIDFASTSATVSYYCGKEQDKKKAVCFGDSITGMFGNKSDYPSMLSLFHNIDAINAGFAGCRWTDHSNANYVPFSMNRLVEAIVSNNYSLQEASPLVDESSVNYAPLFAEHLSNIEGIAWEDIEFVTMFWGTNDWGDNAILKSVDDPAVSNKQRTNVEDAIKYSISQLVGKYPWLKVIVITPYWRAITYGKDSNIDPNLNGDYLYEWAQYIGEVAQDNYNIPIIPLYRTLGANAITNRYFTQDGTHPTEMTKQIIATRISDVISIY